MSLMTADAVVCHSWVCLIGFCVISCVLSLFCSSLYLAISNANVNAWVLYLSSCYEHFPVFTTVPYPSLCQASSLRNMFIYSFLLQEDTPSPCPDKHSLLLSS